MKFVGLPVLAALLAGLCSCRGGDAVSGVTVAIDTVAGVEWVRNSGEPPAWRLDEIVRVRGGDVGFTRVAGITADGNGSIYIADGVESEIRVFDSTGAPLRTIGRKGHGPGEFEDLYPLAWLGDTLAALDPGNARIGLMTATGTWLGQWRAQRMTGSSVRLYEVPGAIYAQGWRPGGATFQETFVRFTAGGAGDTLVWPDLRPPRPTGIECRFPEDQGFAGFAIPFASRPLVTVGARGLVIGMTGAYRIAFLGSRSDTIRVIENALAPMPVAAEEFRDSLAEYRAFRAKYPNTTCDPADPSAPPAKSVLQAILFDDEGRMWVERRTLDGWVYDVFDPAGRLIGQAPAPARDVDLAPYIRRGRVYLVRTDSGGGQVGVVYRVVR